MKQSWKEHRATSLTVVGCVYIFAAVAGAAAFLWAPPWPDLARLALADLVGTLVVWLAGVLLGNASVYDPYWSVAPAVMLGLYLHWRQGWCAPTELIFLVILFWSVRLTCNWAAGFSSLQRQDWRYDLLKARFPRAWHAVNLLGVHLMPTAVVFLAMTPAFLFAGRNGGFNAGVLGAVVVCVGATLLEYYADRQMRAFRAQPENEGRILRGGLWKRSRHPNYLGEILFWWGIWLFLLSIDPGMWYTGLGALVNTLLFLFVSIPLMERRQRQRRPDYDAYRGEAGMLFPRLRGPKK